ncbi:hypothetical protein H5410_010089 [Solanum commersonii]|uniref:Uncharacterized protein n=1 Tax=Solanum commersonii TaxID=4109 RepID=A0A9J6ALH6_SOLCO|nr:hypothetical protein H5410_010089 [Solanum commersonii]
MAIRMSLIIKKSSTFRDVPIGYFVVYVREKHKKRYTCSVKMKKNLDSIIEWVGICSLILHVDHLRK